MISLAIISFFFNLQSSQHHNIYIPLLQKLFDDDDGDLLDLANALRQYSRWRTRKYVSVADNVSFSPMTHAQNDVIFNKISVRNNQFEEKMRSESGELYTPGVATPGVSSDYFSDIKRLDKKHPITLAKKELRELMRYSRPLLMHRLPLVMLKWQSQTIQSQDALAKELLTRWVMWVIGGLVV